MLASRPSQRTTILCVLIVAVAALAAYRIQPIIADSRDAPASGVGVDYRAAVYGPNVLVSERQNPWSTDASVPRFSEYPATPVWPVSYTAYPVLTRIGYTTGLTAFLCFSVVLVTLGCRRIARSLGLSRLAALLIAALVALSPVHLYNVSLGQTAAGIVAAVAFFGVRAEQNPAWWHHAEKWVYGATILFLFAKPTFALTFLAANLAYERSVRMFARFLAIAGAIGLVSFVSIIVRTKTGLSEILKSMRETSSDLASLPGNHMDGDRTDFLSLIVPSPFFDVVAILVVAAGLLWLNRLAHSTLRERLVISVGLVTIGTYHHMYDTLPLLALLCVTVAMWPPRRALMLAVGLILPGWLYGFNVVRRAINEIVPVDFFALSARLVFIVSVAAMALTYRDIKSRTQDPSEPEIGWIDLRSVAC